MRKVFTYKSEKLDKVKEVISYYTPGEIPNITTQITHIRENGSVKFRLMITGNNSDVNSLVSLLRASV